MDGYIKIFRQLLNWEWYTDGNVLRVFLHLLLNANFKPSRFRGLTLPVGALVVSIDSLSASLGLSSQQIRTALKKLESTGEINKQITNKFTIITICKWECYQAETNTEQQTNNKQITDKQQTNNKQITTEEEYKNVRKKEYKDSYINESGEINSPTPPKKKTIDERIADFTEDIRKYENLYPREMLNEFWSYWTERNKSRTKFRAELQKTWDTGRRLATWAKKDDNFNKNINNNGTNQQTNRKNGLTDEEVIEAVTGGLGLHFANQNNRDANN